MQLVLRSILCTVAMCSLVPADDAAAPTRENLRQLAESAHAARQAAADQYAEAVRQSQQLETDLLEKRRTLKQAEQELKAAEGRLAAEQEAAQKAVAARDQAVAARTSAEEALAKAQEVLKPELSEEEKQAAEKAVADAQKQLDEAAKPAAEAMTAAEAAQATVAATQKTITDSKATIEAGAKQVAELQSSLDATRMQVTQLKEALAVADESWVEHQRALEADLRTTGEWVSFTEEIAPVLHHRCLACHNTKTAKGRLNLASYASLMKGGESGESIAVGDVDASYLYSLIEDGSMPVDADPLTEEQLAAVKKWINLGAKLDAGADANLPLIRVMPKPPQPQPPETYRLAIPVTALAFSPDGATLATSGYHEVLLWNVADGALLRRISNVAERIYDIEFHPDGQQLAIAAGTPGQMGEARIVSVSDGSLIRDLVTVEDVVFTATFNHDGSRVATAGADRAIRVFGVESGVEEVMIEDHADWVMSVAWSPDGTRLASASRDKTAKLFDASTGDAQLTFNGHGDVVFGVGFLPDGTQVATSGADNRIRTWTVEKADQKQEIKSHGGDVFQLQVLPDGTAVSCSEDKTARLHNLTDGKETRKLAGHGEWVYAVAAHADTKRIATGSYDGEVRLWSLDEGKLIMTFHAAPGLVNVSIEGAE